MSIPPGTRLGPYEVLGLVGAGGMGEVYRARDPRLAREVAVKVLPAAVTHDPERVRRFEQEARAAGVLNHPNITAVYDIGREDGSLYVVSELLEGETLRSRMAGGALSTRRAVEYALQLAHGLAAAHGKGIVHRDLKPENVFVTNDGRVKILDFGLAKLTRPEEGGPHTNLPTATAGTEPGVVMGTLGYMSPEQVRGRTADARSDIFSFGAILYEMLSGKRAFHGDSAADTMSAILKEDPPELSATNRNVPPGLDRIVRHCLEKNPEQRFHSAHDLAFDLEALSSASGAVVTPAMLPAGARPRLSAIPLLLLGGLAGLLVGAFVGPRLLRPRPAEAPVVRLLTFSGDDWGPSVSPDGKFVAFISSRDGKERVWLKELSGGNEVALTAGPEEAVRFSGDGAWIFFLRREGNLTRTLYRVPVLGGEPRRIRLDVYGATVSPDGKLVAFTGLPLLGPGGEAVLSIAAADGTGSPRVLARLPGGTLASLAWAPDGRRIAAVHQDPGASTIPARLLVIDVDDGNAQTIVPALERGLLGIVEWDRSGRSLLYTRMEAVSTSDLTGVGRLFRCDLRGGSHRLLFSFPRAIGMAGLSVAGSGRLVLDADSSSENLLETAASSGASGFLTHGSATDRQPAYSPDGQWVVFSSSRSGNWDLWQVSRTTGAVRRLTDDPGHDWDPAFTPDGKKLVWSSNRTGPFEIWTAEPDGSAPRQLTRDGVDAENPTATPDGRWVVYDSRNPKHPGLWIVGSDGSGARRIVEGRTIHPEVSPDGRYALFFPVDTAGSNLMRVVELPGGAPANFEIAGLAATRGRWMPDAKRIVFLHRDESGRSGLFIQDFVPGKNTDASRRKLAGFDPVRDTESFGISPDGLHLTLAQIDWGASLLQLDGVPGVAPAAAR